VIRTCTGDDFDTIYTIINDAAEAYRGVIPSDCWHEPYMSRGALAGAIKAGVSFFGFDDAGTLVGVMGLQRVRDVTLIRHAYVRTASRGRGLGATLLDELRRQTTGRVLVGTWADAQWAIRFYQRHGFHLVPETDKDRLLRTYWEVPERQRQVSVVLDSDRVVDHAAAPAAVRASPHG
jgi:GNAT superfamily N-acetyltransferase